MEQIQLRDKALNKKVPTLENVNEAANSTPCIRVQIPTGTIVEINHKLIITVNSVIVEESNTLNVPVGIICQRLEAHGCTVEVFKEEMLYKNAALLEDFISTKIISKYIDTSPYPVDTDFYQAYIRNISNTNNTPVISIISTTSNNASVQHSLKGGNLYTAKPSDCIYSVSIGTAIINIQNYKAYSAASIIDDEIISSKLKHKVLEEINSNHK